MCFSPPHPLTPTHTLSLLLKHKSISNEQCHNNTVVTMIEELTIKHQILRVMYNNRSNSEHLKVMYKTNVSKSSAQEHPLLV